MSELVRCFCKAIEFARFVIGCVVVLVLAFFLTSVFWGMRGIVVEPGRLAIQALNGLGNEPKLIAVTIAASIVSAASIRFAVRLLNRRDDPDFAYLPDDDAGD